MVCEYPHAHHVLPLHEHEGYPVSNTHDFLDSYVQNIAAAVNFLCYDSVTSTVNSCLSLHRYYSELLSWAVKGNRDLKDCIDTATKSFESNVVQLLNDLDKEKNIDDLIKALNPSQRSFKGKGKGMKCIPTKNGVKYLCHEHYQEYYECKLFYSLSLSLSLFLSIYCNIYFIFY